MASAAQLLRHPYCISVSRAKRSLRACVEHEFLPNLPPAALSLTLIRGVSAVRVAQKLHRRAHGTDSYSSSWKRTSIGYDWSIADLSLIYCFKDRVEGSHGFSKRAKRRHATHAKAAAQSSGDEALATKNKRKNKRTG